MDWLVYEEEKLMYMVRRGVSKQARMCGTWATARSLAKRGYSLEEALWLLHPHLCQAASDYEFKLCMNEQYNEGLTPRTVELSGVADKWT